MKRLPKVFANLAVIILCTVLGCSTDSTKAQVDLRTYCSEMSDLRSIMEETNRVTTLVGKEQLTHSQGLARLEKAASVVQKRFEGRSEATVPQEAREHYQAMSELFPAWMIWNSSMIRGEEMTVLRIKIQEFEKSGASAAEIETALEAHNDLVKSPKYNPENWQKIHDVWLTREKKEARAIEKLYQLLSEKVP